jgi:hypothetical protein
MAIRRRTTKKTGNFSKRTTTLSTKHGVTQSHSSKPPGSPTRRTVSHNNGKMRTTYSTKLGGGLTKVTSKTISLVSKPRAKKSGSGSRSRSGSASGSGSGDFWLLSIFFLPFRAFGFWIGSGIYFLLYLFIFGIE